MAKHFLVTLLFFLLLWGTVAVAGQKIETAKQESVADIDDQILELEDLKRGYEAAALRHEDQAERLQFDQESYLEARRHEELADENREMARRIQAEIDRLKEKRLQLLRKGDLPEKGGDGFREL